jgi:hypothetical protein
MSCLLSLAFGHLFLHLATRLLLGDVKILACEFGKILIVDQKNHSAAPEKQENLLG